MKNSSIAILIIAVAIVAGLIGFNIKKVAQAPKQMACTMEAKMCDDGSAVGRTGPNCEFAECPSMPIPTPNPTPTPSIKSANLNSPTNIKIGDTYMFGDYRVFVKLDKIVDSRCPSDVTCIWQGELSATLQVTSGAVGSGPQELQIGTVNNKGTKAGYAFTVNSATLDSVNITVQEQFKKKQ